MNEEADAGMRDETEIRELLALAAVGALDPGEDARLRSQIADRPELAAELARYEEAAASLADAVATPPPPALRASVLAAVRDVPQAGASEPAATPPVASEVAPAPVVPIEAARGRNRRWFAAGAFAAVAAAAVGVLAIGPLRDDGDGGVQVADVVADADAVTIAFDGELDELQLVHSPNHNAVALVGEGVPSLADEQVYELWLVRDDDPQRVDIFEPDDDGRVELLIPDMDPPAGASFAITIEPPGGSDEPTSTAVAATA